MNQLKLIIEKKFNLLSQKCCLFHSIFSHIRVRMIVSDPDSTCKVITDPDPIGHDNLEWDTDE